ncbi:MAG: hypothetical protein U0P45_08685 [Acidimicrobiales bacterium]
MLDRLRAEDPDRPWVVGGAVLALLVALPLVIAGPGNDLDVGNVFRSGRAIARHLSYVPSRPPGAPVHESLVGVLDLLGGPLLTNLASVAAAGILLWSLDRLLREEGIARGGRLGVAFVAANPWFIVAATSTADYVFALMFVVASARALRGERAVLAGVLAAAAMGCRVGSITLLAALAVAELATAERREGAARRVAAMGGVGGLLTVVLFVPSMVAAGGLAFADNDFSHSSPLVQLGRALAKDLMLIGLPTAIVALVALPAVVAALRGWRSTWLVRFSATGLVLSQVLFVRFPWKMAHLLPCLLCLAILYAVALQERPRVLAAMVALQLLFAVVRLDVLAPDKANAASGGRIDPGITWGPVVTDLRCRHRDPDAYLGRQKEEIEVSFECASPYSG